MKVAVAVPHKARGAPLVHQRAALFERAKALMLQGRDAIGAERGRGLLQLRAALLDESLHLLRAACVPANLAGPMESREGGGELVDERDAERAVRGQPAQ